MSVIYYGDIINFVDLQSTLKVFLVAMETATLHRCHVNTYIKVYFSVLISKSFVHLCSTIPISPQLKCFDGCVASSSSSSSVCSADIPI